MSQPKGTIKFRLIMYALFLAPVLFTLVDVGTDAVRTRVISLLLSFVLSFVFLMQDFGQAIHTDNVDLTWPKSSTALSVLGLLITGACLPVAMQLI